MPFKITLEGPCRVAPQLGPRAVVVFPAHGQQDRGRPRTPKEKAVEQPTAPQFKNRKKTALKSEPCPKTFTLCPTNLMNRAIVKLENPRNASRPTRPVPSTTEATGQLQSSAEMDKLSRVTRANLAT